MYNVFNQNRSRLRYFVYSFKTVAASLLLTIVVGTTATADGISETRSAVDKPTISFTRDIMPIYADTCLACHGLDESTRAADLRLDQRQEAIDAGVLVPGDADASEMIARVLSDDADMIMPPPDSHKVLTEAQKQKLKTWVNEGAIYEKHWSFEAPKLPTPPPTNDAWATSELDKFVLADLKEHDLQPSPEADLRSLLRRVSLDLTGLPPSPEEIERVINDEHADRYERFVDELLQRSTWGEHRARYWLDYARYGDTNGIHFDNYREMYSYRTWLINAFNSNMPFDQFTVEQLAGDLLPNRTLDQQIATGFQRCNITTSEGGIIDEEYNVLYARDRVETVGAVWMGLTVGCAVCHDHKFDPISQKEFYQLSAFFNNTTQPTRDGNRKDAPPTVNVPRREDRARYDQLRQLQDENNSQLVALRAEGKSHFDDWLASDKLNQAISTRIDSISNEPCDAKLTLHVPLKNVDHRELAYSSGTSEIRTQLLDQDPAQVEGVLSEQAWVIDKNLLPTWPTVGNFEKDESFTVAFWIRPPKDVNFVGSVVARMEANAAHRGWDVWFENGRIAMHMVSNWPQNAIKVTSEQSVAPEQWSHVAMTYDGSGKAEGIKCVINGKSSKLAKNNDTLSESIRTEVPLRLGGRDRGDIAANVGLSDLRIYSGVLPSPQNYVLAILNRLQFMMQTIAIHGQSPTVPQREELFEYYLANEDAQYRAALDHKYNLAGEVQKIEAAGTVAHVMQEQAQPAIAFVLNRGEYDQRRDEVLAITPTVLPAMDKDLPKNRLGLARWLVAPENPLTARVTVNRCWQEIFGRGLVATTGDFGTTGDLPSNQELLDYLSVEFRNDGWDLKDLYRRLVTSATYRQSQFVTPEKLESDPANVLLSRGPRFRMDAEMIRDYALSISGLMNSQIGGRSVRPYQPIGVWEAVAMPESNTGDYKLDEEDMLYRRSMYTFWKRAAPPASMEIFNAPSREVCTVRRERTNTPLQALVTMNDPQFIEAARVLAQQAIQDERAETQRDKIQSLANKILLRSLTAIEETIVLKTLTQAIDFYRGDEAAAKQLIATGKSEVDSQLDPHELAAWTLVVNQLMNLDEVLCK